MVNLIDLFHQKLELFRLEQRYTRRRHRRSTFVSEATYVDGEYIYSPTSQHSVSYSAKVSAGNNTRDYPQNQNSWSTGGSSSDSDRSDERERDYERDQVPDMRDPRPEQKNSTGRGLGRRLSRMGMGGSKDKRENRMSVREVRWNDDVRA
ncbi:hypothetical protein F5884DRAFT_14674 [Xylogone sp. PMI_703]|nr:hypothetical protein F5884DRAFT_14674 [Xylogone sp. PMI_703]